MNRYALGGVWRGMRAPGMRPTWVLVLLLAAGPVAGQVKDRVLQVNFTPSDDSIRAATDEYKAIWGQEGPRIVPAMERRSGLRFEAGPIEVSVYEGTSYSGEPGGRPMLLRASYPAATKRATLVHELAHRLANDVRVPFDHHEVIFLFVYDVWVELWGQMFADEQVVIESRRTGADYAGMWKKVLAMSPAERAGRLKAVIAEYGTAR